MTDREKKRVFTTLCEENYPRIASYLQSHLTSPEDAQDLTQEVFLLAYERINLLAVHENPVGFLYRTARNLLYEKLRYNAKHRLIELNEEQAGSDGDAYDELVRQAEAEIDETAYIEQALSVLTPEKRALYDAYYVEKKPMKELSAAYGISEGTMRVRFSRLRDEVRAQVAALELGKF